VGFVLAAGMAAAGLLLGVGAGWMLLAVVAALSAWDLDAFVRRLKDAARVVDRDALERQHLLRLLMVDGLGLGLAAVALGVRVRLGFGLVILLGILAILGLSRVISLLRHESD
jgi:hypothetical protein